MQIRICDRCEKNLSKWDVDNTIVHVEYQGSKGFDWWLGKSRNVDLCEECFKEFWEFKNSKTSVN